jgi:hypothetical protein
MAGYLGQKPTPSPLTTSDLNDGIVTTAKIAASAVTAAKLAADAATDLAPVRQDIAMLALYNAVSDNRAAYNLPFSFIDQFEDDTGIATETTVDRDSSGEYVSSIYDTSGAFVSDSQTSLLIHSNTTNGSTTFTDSSSYGHTVEMIGTISHSTTQNKLGTTGIAHNGSNGLKIPWHSSLQFDADFTVELWAYFPSSLGVSDRLFSHWPDHHFSNGGQWFIRGDSDSAEAFNMAFGSSGGHSTTGEYFNTSAWNHIAMQRDGSNITVYINGTKRIDEACHTGTTGDRQYITVGCSIDGPSEHILTGHYTDEIRISKGIARYTSNFTPASDSSTTSATGTLISDTQTSSVATTKMSGVILYKDNAGTATLGTDLKIYLSANGGTNYTEVSAGDFGTVTPLFSTGVKMVRLAEQTVTSGTTPVMKAVWASQASGTLETQLHGWAMNY